MNPVGATPCELCAGDGGALVWRNAELRVIQAAEPEFPAFYRVVWNAHVAEMSDLGAGPQARLMAAVLAVEQVLREVLAPAKINLASLGNMVPHLHWHVIARDRADSRWPAPVWAPAQRAVEPALAAAWAARQPELARRIRERLAP